MRYKFIKLKEKVNFYYENWHTGNLASVVSERSDSTRKDKSKIKNKTLFIRRFVFEKNRVQKFIERSGIWVIIVNVTEKKISQKYRKSFHLKLYFQKIDFEYILLKIALVLDRFRIQFSRKQNQTWFSQKLNLLLKMLFLLFDLSFHVELFPSRLYYRCWDILYIYQIKNNNFTHFYKFKIFYMLR